LLQLEIPRQASHILAQGFLLHLGILPVRFFYSGMFIQPESCQVADLDL
jgi:hypothetical protein